MSKIAENIAADSNSPWVQCPDRGFIIRTGGVYNGAEVAFETAIIDTIDNDTGVITVLANTTVVHTAAGSDPSYLDAIGAEKVETLTKDCAMRIVTTGGGGSTSVSAWAFTQRFG